MNASLPILPNVTKCDYRISCIELFLVTLRLILLMIIKEKSMKDKRHIYTYTYLSLYICIYIYMISSKPFIILCALNFEFLN